MRMGRCQGGAGGTSQPAAFGPDRSMAALENGRSSPHPHPAPQPGAGFSLRSKFVVIMFWAEFTCRGPVMDHARFGLAGMKGLPNDGSLFKAASRELGPGCFICGKILASGCAKVENYFGDFTRTAVYFLKGKRRVSRAYGV